MAYVDLLLLTPIYGDAACLPIVVVDQLTHFLDRFQLSCGDIPEREIGIRYSHVKTQNDIVRALVGIYDNCLGCS
jgi:hypothetical protein